MIASRPLRPLTRLAAALLILHAAAAARAGLVIEVANNVTATPGSTGSFDVLLIDNDSSQGPTYHVAGDSFRLALTGIAGVQFTSATIATTTPYIYVTSGTTVAPPSPLSFDTFPNTSFTASDAEFASPLYRAVGPGSTFGLAHVTYTVAAGASGVGSLSFQDVGGATSLSDELGNALAFTTRGGTFTVNAGAVPEPSSISLVLVGAACAAGARFRSRRHA